MFLFVFALASAVSAGNHPCLEPDTDYRLPSECSPGQVLHSNVCRSYFLLRSEAKACLVSEGVVYTPRVTPDEVLCPLAGKNLDCRLYQAFNAECTSFERPSQKSSCNEYNAQGEYENFKACTELTEELPPTGITNRFTFYPDIIGASLEGLCPTGYCPANSDKCIRWGKSKNGTEPSYGYGVLESVDKTIMFDHGKIVNVTNAANFRTHFMNSQRVPGGR